MLHTLHWCPSREQGILDGVLLQCPQLTSLHSAVLPRPTPIAISVLRSLTPGTSFRHWDRLCPFSRLCSLSIEVCTSETTQALGGLRTAVTSCHIDTSANVLLGSFPRLRHLTLSLDSPPDSLLPIPPLADLAVVVLSAGTADDKMQAALHFARACPSLQVIHFDVSDEPTTPPADFLRELDQSAVQELRVSFAWQKVVPLHWLTVHETSWLEHRGRWGRGIISF